MTNIRVFRCVSCDEEGPFDPRKWTALFENRQIADLWTTRTTSCEGDNLVVVCDGCYDPMVVQIRSTQSGIGHQSTAVVAYDLSYTDPDGFTRAFNPKAMLNRVVFTHDPALGKILSELVRVAAAIEDAPMPGLGAMS